MSPAKTAAEKYPNPKRNWKNNVLRRTTLNSRVTRWMIEWAETHIGTFTLIAQPDDLVTDVFAPHLPPEGDEPDDDTEHYNFQEPGKGVWLRLPTGNNLYYPLNLTKFTTAELLAAKEVIDAAFELAELTTRFRDLYAKDHPEMERNYRRDPQHMRRDPNTGAINTVRH